jgi:hypothetical protein
MFIWWTPAGRHTWRKRKGVSTLAFCKVKVSYFFTFWHHAFLHGTYFNATCWKVGQRETIIGPDCHETLLVFWILVWPNPKLMWSFNFGDDLQQPGSGSIVIWRRRNIAHTDLFLQAIIIVFCSNGAIWKNLFV